MNGFYNDGRHRMAGGSGEGRHVNEMDRGRYLLVTADVDAVRQRLAGESASPRQDFVELARGLEARILSFADVDRSRDPLCRLIGKTLGKAAALAWLGFRLNGGFYFTTAENTGMVLALMLKARRPPPIHVMIGHRISAGKKRWLWKGLRLFDRISAMICYSGTQVAFATCELGIAPKRLHRIHFQVDERFFTPSAGAGAGVVSVGRELRDYPTLFEAVDGTGIPTTVVASSPWSRREDQTANRRVPANVTLRRGLSSEELREVYRSAAVVVVPLQDVDSPAGVTSMLEAQAVGKPVIISESPGIRDSIGPEKHVVIVPCGDAGAMRAAIEALLSDPQRAASLGRLGREAVLAQKTLDHFTANIRRICRGAEDIKRP
jgi:glycosyltransferase involved in cell wall biosynthesis